MQKFFGKLIKYTFIFLVVYMVIVASVLLARHYAAKQYAFNDDTKYLIVGDSHIMWGINDKYIKHAENVALNAEGYLYTYAKLKHLLEQPRNIEKVLLGASYHNLSDYYNEYIYGQKITMVYTRYFDILEAQEYFDLIVNNPKNFFELGRGAIQNGLSGIFKSRYEYIGSFPKEEMCEQLDLAQVNKRITEQYFYSGEISSFSKNNLKYLYKIIDLCKSKNLELVFLNTPMSSAYADKVPQKFKTEYQKIILDYGLSEIAFENLVLPDSLYLPDGDHLNCYGAVATSKRLNQILETHHETQLANPSATN